MQDVRYIYYIISYFCGKVNKKAKNIFSNLYSFPLYKMGKLCYNI